MERWIPLELDTEGLIETRTIRGRNVDLLVSPYDVPEAIRGYHQKEEKCYVIEFKYIGSDEEIIEKKQDHITMYIGAITGRVFKVKIALDGLSTDQAANKISNAIERLIGSSSEIKSPDNYRLASTAVSHSVAQLTAPSRPLR